MKIPLWVKGDLKKSFGSQGAIYFDVLQNYWEDNMRLEVLKAEELEAETRTEVIGGDRDSKLTPFPNVFDIDNWIREENIRRGLEGEVRIRLEVIEELKGLKYQGLSKKDYISRLMELEKRDRDKVIRERTLRMGLPPPVEENGVINGDKKEDSLDTPPDNYPSEAGDPPPYGVGQEVGRLAPDLLPQIGGKSSNDEGGVIGERVSDGGTGGQVLKLNERGLELEGERISKGGFKSVIAKISKKRRVGRPKGKKKKKKGIKVIPDSPTEIGKRMFPKSFDYLAEERAKKPPDALGREE